MSGNGNGNGEMAEVIHIYEEPESEEVSFHCPCGHKAGWMWMRRGEKYPHITCETADHDFAVIMLDESIAFRMNEEDEEDPLDDED
jgi:hypothetical protein